ncbi:unnamed protein product [Anisakis simplex]|uniref:Uncharacterized protein n=1 Tax=Anisakis simplex TaxID=6269 RepID=A0A0M3KBT2_ANISI|nr:unnamed protein product [Anisakis simplex]
MRQRKLYSQPRTLKASTQQILNYDTQPLYCRTGKDLSTVKRFKKTILCMGYDVSSVCHLSRPMSREKQVAKKYKKMFV